MDRLDSALLAEIQHREPAHGMEIYQDYYGIASEHFSGGNYDVRDIAGSMIFAWREKNPK